MKFSPGLECDFSSSMILPNTHFVIFCLWLVVQFSGLPFSFSVAYSDMKNRDIIIF